jgi:Tol biopolymer transport system component
MRLFPSVFRVPVLLLLVAALAGALPPTSAAAGAQAAPSFGQFLKIRVPGSPNVLPDGSLLVIDWPDGVRQLYRFTPKSTTPGQPVSYKPADCTVTRLTDFPDGLTSYSVSKDGKRAVLMHARGGNENWQLSLLDLNAAPGTGMTPILADPKVQASVNFWLRDDSGIVYSANAESPNDFYVYRYDFATGKTTQLVGKEGAWSGDDATQDGSRVLISHGVSA